MTTSTRSKDAFGLNDEQRAAVEHRDGPLLVVAGAGTGKTRVITERIRTLLESDPNLAGENILGLTFTDKSAGEMKYRVVKSIGERAEGVWLSTFHKFCLEKILRPANPDIQPLDDIDHRILLRRNIAELGLVHFWRLAEPAEFLRDFVTFFSRCQDELVTPDDYQRYAEGLRRKHDARKAALDPDTVQIAEDEVARQEELARVYRVSERLLRDRNLHTFGAQILQSVELLRNDAALLDQMRGQYRYILVDEFQDTNIAQLELLWLLSAKHRNIMVVGDHNQAIYRFRGASYGSFTTFLQRFCETNAKGAAPATKKFLVSLAQNYRSTKRILNVADAVIRNNEQSPLIPQNALRTDNRDGEKIRVVEFGMPEEEAQWVASEIDRMHLAGAPWRSFAVLYRRHTHRNQLLDALRRKRIPFVIRKFSILTSTVVRDLLAYLQLIANPSDNVACARVLAAPYWRAEPRDLVRLAERSEKNHRRPIWDEIESALREDSTDGLPINRWREETRLSELVELVHTLRQAARRKSATELLDDLIRSLELAPLPSEADRQYLERFVAFVGEWERKSEDKRLRDFIEYLGYFNELDGDICLDEEVAEDAVQLMTVHSAKGLEFPHVFILRLAKGDFPTGSRRPVFEFPAELMKEERPEGDFQIQEERPAESHSLDGDQQAQEAFALSRRLPDGPEGAEVRRGAVRSSGGGAAIGGYRGSRARFGRSVAAFRSAPGGYSRLFANRSVGEGVSSAKARAFAAKRLRDRRIRAVPDEVHVSIHVESPRKSSCADYIRQRNAHDRERMRGRDSKRPHRAVRRGDVDLRARVVGCRLHRRIPRTGISQGGPGTARSVSSQLLRCARRRVAPGEIF
jgi:DNA helicase-2/ATP-dependent DNA helicase PcrA